MLNEVVIFPIFTGSMVASQTVTFNVGGKHYEVSKSLLERYPETLLAKKAASTESLSSPIFLDRDPDRFAYCLDYMRDNGKVHLPEAVSKSAVLEELVFLGFQDILDESILDDKPLKQLCARRMNDVIISVNKEIADMETNIEMAKLAMHCYRECSKTTTKDITFIVNMNEFGEAPMLNGKLAAESYFKAVCEKLGLEYISIQYSHGYAKSDQRHLLSFKRLL